VGGIVAVFGSGEFEQWAEEVDRFLLSAATSGDGTVAVVPTASATEGSSFYDWGHKGLEHYARLGVPARVIEVRSRQDAHRPELAAELVGPSLIFFSGGNPAFLARTLKATPFWDGVLGALDRGAAIAGCSAGACTLWRGSSGEYDRSGPGGRMGSGIPGASERVHFPALGHARFLP
jgi:cyanophycinase-like exopeptidase